MFEKILLSQCDIDVNDYCKETKQGRKWSASKLQGTDILDCLNENYKNQGGFSYNSPVYSDHIKALILYKSQDDSLKKLIGDIRTVEANIRNLAPFHLIKHGIHCIKL